MVDVREGGIAEYPPLRVNTPLFISVTYAV